MIPIQAVLILSLAVALCMYITWFRSTLLDRLLVFAIGSAVVVLIMIPELSTTLANKFGVGRGADLIFYLSHSGMALALIFLYAKLRSQTAQITELTRTIASYHARISPDSEDHLARHDGNVNGSKAPARQQTISDAAFSRQS